MSMVAAEGISLAAMTRKEFSTRSEEIRKITAWYMFISMTVLWAWMIAALLLQHLYGNRFEAIDNIVLAIIGGGGVGGMAWVPWQLARKRGVVCPACNKALIEQARGTALLTGKCPKCRNSVFTEDTRSRGHPVGAGWLTREQFNAQLQALARKSVRRGVFILIMGFGLVATTIYLSRQFQDAVDRGRFDNLLPTDIRWIAAIVIAAGSVCVLGLPLLGATVRVKTSGVPCPQCSRPLAGLVAGAAIEKGICVYCGAPLFDEPPSPSK